VVTTSLSDVRAAVPIGEGRGTGTTSGSAAHHKSALEPTHRAQKRGDENEQCAR